MSYTYYRRYRTPRRRSSGFQSFCAFVFVVVAILLLVYGGVKVFNYFWEERQDEAVLSVVKGAATVQEWGSQEPHLASDAEVILVGDTVHTGFEAWATLRLLDGSELRLDSDTTVTLKSANQDDEKMELVLSLGEGRVWLEQAANRDPAFKVTVQTSVMDVQGDTSAVLVRANSEQESVRVFADSVKVNYVDRARQEGTVDASVLKAGDETVLTAELKRALLARENVNLVHRVEGDALLAEAEDPFLRWSRDGVLMVTGSGAAVVEESSDVNTGSTEASESRAEDSTPEKEAAAQEGVPTPKEESEQPEADLPTVPALQITLGAPGASVSIQKDAIALEGRVTAGQASRVEIIWDGDGKPYALSAYEPGSSDFRYVADSDYGNLKKGVNHYTIRAYDADGKVSNTLSVTVQAEF